METRVVKVSLDNVDILNEAGALLRSGELVAFPTETVYGLGANAYDSEACKNVFIAKGRPSDNPLIVHVSEPSEAESIAYTCPLYYELAKKFMPGPLTVILPKKDVIPSEATGGLDTVAVRCPENEIARELIRAAKIPVAAPSANASGKPSPTLANHVYNDLNGKIPLILDGGSSKFGVESTVISITDGKITVLRPGSVTPEMLATVCDVEIAAAVKSELKSGEVALSPGMKYKHYAPSASLYLIDDSSIDFVSFAREKQNCENTAIMCYDEEIPYLDKKNLLPVGKKQDIEEQTHRLFDLLRRADELGVHTAYAHLPSESGASLAMYNRLIRACAHRIIGGKNGEK